MSGFTAASSAIAGGGAASSGAAPSPSFMETITFFQGMAMNGMSSVAMPSIYRQFSKNFAFSVGLVNFERMQLAIDDFRASTGGNTTKDSVQYLSNATLVFSDGSIEQLGSSSSKFKRTMAELYNLIGREITTSVNTTDTDTSSSSNSTSSDSSSSSSNSEVTETVQGIKAYVEELSIPDANTFMTVLLIVACIMAAIILIILLVKVILEAWALFGNLPKGMSGFRKHYWVTMSRLLTQLIMLLYGTWVLYCMYQFMEGDSWAAKLLAGLTLALFTGVLAFFAYKVISTAKRLEKTDGDVSGLYEKKDLWIKYKLFYDNYKKSYWWLFIPMICYMFAKGVIMAVGDKHGMAQSIAQFVLEAIMLAILVWNRPFERKSGNVLNISIQVVRILSVVCIFIFIDELGIGETTQTVVGLVLVVIQAALAGILAILIIWNAVVAIFKENPHRKRRKEMGKSKRTISHTIHLSRSSANIPVPHRENARPRQPHAARRPQLAAPGPQGLARRRLGHLLLGQDQPGRQGDELPATRAPRGAARHPPRPRVRPRIARTVYGWGLLGAGPRRLRPEARRWLRWWLWRQPPQQQRLWPWVLKNKPPLPPPPPSPRGGEGKTQEKPMHRALAVRDWRFDNRPFRPRLLDIFFSLCSKPLLRHTHNPLPLPTTYLPTYLLRL